MYVETVAKLCVDELEHSDGVRRTWSGWTRSGTGRLDLRLRRVHDVLAVAYDALLDIEWIENESSKLSVAGGNVDLEGQGGVKSGSDVDSVDGEDELEYTEHGEVKPDDIPDE